ncbi:MAG: DUF4263 domain-containing protein [Bacteroidia bacterium]|nr:DUF4263 domain-containing protein [Bacteroidia bacterium]
MKKGILLPNQENVFSDDPTKTVYYFYDIDKLPIHKTKEIYKAEKKVVVYPYSYNRVSGELKSKRIKVIEFIGWQELEHIPNDFRKTPGYGIKSKRLKSVFSLIYPKFKNLSKLTLGTDVHTKFLKNQISINWGDLENILKKVSKEFSVADSERKNLIINHLSLISSKFTGKEKILTAGELENYLSRYKTFEKITKDDAESLAKVFEKLPAGKILTTNHFIKTRERLDTVYLEDVITNFKKLLSITKDNEEQWQNFFEKYSWMLAHLFPYQVILRKGKAYVGGKTLENNEGRIVDFLFRNNLDDNYALLEIKTHNKDLLKGTTYRKPDVFSMSEELSGGLNQCLDQKDTFLKEFGQKEKTYDPKCILIIGLKTTLTKHQAKCFELLRANQKNVDIITFDELLAKLEGLLKVITGQYK